MGERSLNNYYKEMLKLGLEYQDFVVEQLYKNGLPIVSYSSKMYQIKMGENKPGFEIKFDRKFKETGNFYIETFEKSDARNPNFIRSGIFRDDNTWLYIVGDYFSIFVFSKKQLRLIYETKSRKIKLVTTPTSKGFLLPVGYAKKFLAIKEIKIQD